MTRCSQQSAQVVAVLFLSVLLGCFGGASDQPELGQVTGTVTLGGQPLPNAKVRFQPPDGRSALGVTDENGVYTLQYNIGVNGTKTGPNDVYITTATDGHREGASATSEGVWIEGAPERVPARYMQPGALTAEVKPGKNTIDFALDPN